MARKKTFQIFREAKKSAPYDERPMLPDTIDVQVHVSRNDRPQPFFLICEKDTLIAQVAGEGHVEFKDTAVARFALAPGDYVYVPAGAPHRLVPAGESVNLRYKAARAGLEGVAWYCETCGGEIYRDVWDTAATLPQEGYLETVQRFNGDAALRVCAGCGTEHPEIDLKPYRWEALASDLRAESASA